MAVPLFIKTSINHYKDYKSNKDNMTQIENIEELGNFDNKEQSIHTFLQESLTISHEYGDMDFIVNTKPIKPRSSNPVFQLTQRILQTYKAANQKYEFKEEMKPRRELTEPKEGVYNNGRDNINNDLIVFVGDIISNGVNRYKVIDLLGNGVSGQVFKCKIEREEEKEGNNNESEGSYIEKDLIALKIIKNKRIYSVQSLIEIKLLDKINKEIDPDDKHHFIRKIDSFCFSNHVCICFELLNENLYELLKKNFFKGLTIKTVRYIMKALLEATSLLHENNIIHCDLKPENVLLKILPNDIQVKVTDFGTACDKSAAHFIYLQSRYYRSPEVIIGNPYSIEIDIWSLGCIGVELFLGDPLFPGVNEYDQIKKISDMLGGISNSVRFNNPKVASRFFKKTGELKSEIEYLTENPSQSKSEHGYPCNINNLDDILRLKSKVNEQNYREAEMFINFIKKFLVIDPKKRITAKEALKHVFITNKKKTDLTSISHLNDESVENCNKSINNSFFSTAVPYQIKHTMKNIHYDTNNTYNNTNTSNTSSFFDTSFNYYGPIASGFNIKQNNIYTMTNDIYNLKKNNETDSNHDKSCFDLDPSLIPYKALTNFPYVKMNEVLQNKGKLPIDVIMAKDDKEKGKKKDKQREEKYINPNMNRSFTEVNYEKLEGEEQSKLFPRKMRYVKERFEKRQRKHENYNQFIKGQVNQLSNTITSQQNQNQNMNMSFGFFNRTTTNNTFYYNPSQGLNTSFNLNMIKSNINQYSNIYQPSNNMYFTGNTKVNTSLGLNNQNNFEGKHQFGVGSSSFKNFTSNGQYQNMKFNSSQNLVGQHSQYSQVNKNFNSQLNNFHQNQYNTSGNWFNNDNQTQNQTSFNNKATENSNKRLRSYTDQDDEIKGILKKGKAVFSNLDADSSFDNINYNKNYKFGVKKSEKNENNQMVRFMIKEEDEV